MAISVAGPEARGLAAPLRALVREALAAAGRTPGEIGVTLADDARLRELNLRWRGLDRATDVLSFPYGAEDGASRAGRGPGRPGPARIASPGARPGPGRIASPGARRGAVTGDIIVSLDRVHEQARRYRVSRGRELGRLVIHGALHLAGLDHHAPAERKQMRTLEARALRAGARAIAALQRAALALACALGLACCAALSAAPARAQASPKPTLEDVRRFMLAADTVVIGHYKAMPAPPAHSDTAQLYVFKYRPMSGARVTREWVARFLDAALVPARYDSGEVCNLFAVSMDTLQPMMFSIIAQPHGRAIGIGLELRTRCAGVFDHGEEIGAIDVDPAAEKLFALVREALPRDSTLRSATLPPKFEPPGGRRKGRPAPAPEQPPIVTDPVPPEYPLSARKAGISGTVQVNALVDRNGNVAQAVITSPVSADLDSAAVTAVRQWKFKPASDGHQPVAVWVTLPVKFTLR